MDLKGARVKVGLITSKNISKLRGVSIGRKGLLGGFIDGGEISRG